MWTRVVVLCGALGVERWGRGARKSSFSRADMSTAPSNAVRVVMARVLAAFFLSVSLSLDPIPTRSRLPPVESPPWYCLVALLTFQLREKTARSNAVVLEMIGDLPDADMKPPENVLFVCKLNPVTTDDDLEIIFTRCAS